MEVKTKIQMIKREITVELMINLVSNIKIGIVPLCMCVFIYLVKLFNVNKHKTLSNGNNNWRKKKNQYQTIENITFG